MSATPLPEQLTPCGFSDDDEGWGQTIEEYVRNRNDAFGQDEDSENMLVVGDEFFVDAQWYRVEKWRVVSGPTANNPDAPIVCERVAPRTT